MPNYDVVLFDADNAPCGPPHGDPGPSDLSPERSESAPGSGALAPSRRSAGPNYDVVLFDADNAPCGGPHGDPGPSDLSPERSESAPGSGALAPSRRSAGPNYDVVLFDADNTLFDFDRAEERALCQTLEHYGLPVTEAVRARYLEINHSLWDRFDQGEVRREWLVVERFSALQRELGGDHDSAGMNRYYLSRLGEGADLLPGAEALCAALAPHCTLAIVTNGVAQAQRGRFSRSPLGAYIPHLFISGELGWQKPQREFFAAVLAALGNPAPDRCVVVGDSLAADILGANNAGLASIWYHPSGLPARREVCPTYTVRTFDEIASIILG